MIPKNTRKYLPKIVKSTVLLIGTWEYVKLCAQYMNLLVFKDLFQYRNYEYLGPANAPFLNQLQHSTRPMWFPCVFFFGIICILYLFFLCFENKLAMWNASHVVSKNSNWWKYYGISWEYAVWSLPKKLELNYTCW